MGAPLATGDSYHASLISRIFYIGSLQRDNPAQDVARDEVGHQENVYVPGHLRLDAFFSSSVGRDGIVRGQWAIDDSARFRSLMRRTGEPERVFTIDEIAGEFAISHNHLTKGVRELAEGGFVAAHRGEVGPSSWRAQPRRSRSVM